MTVFVDLDWQKLEYHFYRGCWYVVSFQSGYLKLKLYWSRMMLSPLAGVWGAEKELGIRQSMIIGDIET